MELSCKTEYALLALLELATCYSSGEPLQIRQIASQQNIPDRYLEQLLASLRRAGFVRSQRGAKGGYLLARAPWQILLSDVIEAIEGADTSGTGLIDTADTVEKSTIREVWQEACQAAQAVLSNHSLQDLHERRTAKQQRDFMYYI